MRGTLRLVSLIALATSGCRQDMYNQPKAKTYSANDFFADGASARPLPRHTVQFHEARGNDELTTGLTSKGLTARLPVPLTPELLQRGEERFNVYCSVCHGSIGDGHGAVVQRGFPAPPTFQSDRLRNAPIGHFYDVITNGYGVMYSYASRVEPADRWAIAAYIRALQLSQHASVPDLSPNEQRTLDNAQ